MVHETALSLQQHVQPSVSKPRPLLCQRAKTFAHAVFLHRHSAVTAARSPKPDHSTRPAFTHCHFLPQIAHGSAPSRGRQYFFEITNFSAWLSNVRSATKCFNR